MLITDGLAVVALFSLVGLLRTDPGVVKRSPATCYPQPEQARFTL